MAVTTVKYTKTSSNSLIKYAMNREAEHNETAERRTAFTADQSDLNNREAREEMKQYEQGEKFGYTYHLVMNAGDGLNREENYKEWARDTMRDLELKCGKTIPYVGVIHDNHSNHQHIHIVAHLDRTLRKEEVNYFREAATKNLEYQKELVNQVKELEFKPQVAHQQQSEPEMRDKDDSDSGSGGSATKGGGQGQEIESEQPKERRIQAEWS